MEFASSAVPFVQDEYGSETDGIDIYGVCTYLNDVNDFQPNCSYELDSTEW